ncbi:MAG TPA: ABC transporter ATP-binding protein [Thermoclostridium sp.]|nr:ABC transporter ATP-binding protein [Clostridiaceae bacterium]HOQ75405.1 ABC transporter ATP-binding protein [Thermoclostridium sp.]HPU44617.1 ABC transporter ATP-binding protein [Thermoclostridium sp.]
MSKLIIKNLYKRYENKGKKKTQPNDFAVNNLSLECEDGEFIGILGPSGCGKTTTLRMIAGLEDITAGDIFIGDQRINDLHPKDRNIGLAFEDYALYPPLTVYDNIAFNLKAKGVPADQIKERVMEIAPLLKVEDLLDKMPISLSGGQKQRVNIARAIVRRPGLLLLDEPLSHLDGKMRQALRTEIKRLHNEIRCTTVYVTHDQLEAMSLADRIAIMNLGVLQQFGTPMEVYDDPANEFVAGFIGEPPMNLLKTTIIHHDGDYYFTFENSDLRILAPRRYYDLLSDGMQVKMGVRPTDIFVGGPDSKGTPVKVAVFEDLCSERRIGVRVGDELVMLITEDDTRYRQGEMIKLEVNGEKTHLFDLQTGNRIRPNK